MTVPVVHVITRLELGGAQQNTLHTVAALDRTRFAPVLVCGTGGMLDDEARELSDVPVHFLPELVRPISPRRDLAAVAAVTSLLRPLAARGPVVVHTHSSKAGIVGRAAARRAGARPVVHSVHGFGHAAIGNPLIRRVALAIERRMARHTDAFVSVAAAHIERGRRLGLYGDRPVELIRSGIDVDAFTISPALCAETRRRLGIPERAPVVGMIACLKPQKAPLDVADIAAELQRHRDDAWFLIAGDGELRDALEQRLGRLGVGSRVRLLGWRRDVPALLGAFDVVLLTSRWEGLPRVCPQAMAAGRPIVATGVDGVPEAVVDGRNGLLFAPGDVRTAADHIARLLDDPALALRMGAAGREAVGEFRQESMVAAQEALYDRLLGGATRPA